jgi:hypothetical protein
MLIEKMSSPYFSLICFLNKGKALHFSSSTIYKVQQEAHSHASWHFEELQIQCKAPKVMPTSRINNTINDRFSQATQGVLVSGSICLGLLQAVVAK